VIRRDYINHPKRARGLVHTAPGHGVDDFQTPQKYNLAGAAARWMPAATLTAKPGRSPG